MTAGRPTRGMSVRWLLLAVNALILLVPIATFLSLRLYHAQLVRQTEVKLIAESVLIGEAFRAYLLEEQGRPTDRLGDILPATATDERYAPIEPVLGDDYDVLPRVADPQEFCSAPRGAPWRAGGRLKALLDRAQTFNLSSARVIDAEGCVVASSGSWLTARLTYVPEVEAALAGHYHAVARERLSDEPKPSMFSISRRGDVRVFTATPVLEDGRVVAAVWMSRTAMDPIKAAWLSRWPLLIGLGICLLLTVAVSLFLSRRITQPLSLITSAAGAVARGERSGPLPVGGVVPAEIHDLDRAIATMATQLSDRADYIADFAANVSHELKSPITSIQGATELLAEEADGMPPEQRARFLANISADAARMERLVVRLLELARIQSAPASAERLEVEPFLRRLTEAAGERVALELDAPPEAVVINADHLESAVRNLLENALAHGGDGPVTLRASSEGDRLVIEVADHGPGIREADQGRLFDRFFTTHRDEGGTGLGLAIVQAVAQTRGGRVDFDTGPQGTTFRLVV